MKKFHVDAVIAGAGISSILAALSILKNNKSVFMSEETTWIGGQFSSQAVPPDENKYIETSFGASKTYLDFRKQIRNYYQEIFDISDNLLNPGEAWVSNLSADPSVFEHFFMKMLMPYLIDGSLILCKNSLIDHVHKFDDKIQYIIFYNHISKERSFVSGGIFIDGTELGELIKYSATDYFIGAESQKMTGETMAPSLCDSADLQPITWVAALKKYKTKKYNGAAPKITKPQSYDFWKSLKQPYDVHHIFSWFGPDSQTFKAKPFTMYQGEQNGIASLWDYRRIFSAQRFQKTEDTSLLNWPQNDYFLGNIIEGADASYHKEMAKELSLSFAYWLQNEAPNFSTKGIGYPEISLDYYRLGTDSGLALYPYIRESRRIKAMQQVSSDDLIANKSFKDSIGIGSYHIDLHITTKSNSFLYKDIKPFQIPLSALIPQKTENLLAIGKNIGTTHLSSSAFRLHPVEWNIGESAGYYASYILDHKITPKQGTSINHYGNVLKILHSQGVLTSWTHNNEKG